MTYAVTINPPVVTARNTGNYGPKSLARPSNLPYEPWTWQKDLTIGESPIGHPNIGCLPQTLDDNSTNHQPKS